MTAISYFVFILCGKMCLSRGMAYGVSMSLLFATTSMGSLLSIDSVHNVGAVFFGMLSMMYYLKDKYLLWFIWGIIAAFSKENGFVWFVAGPIVQELIRQRNAYGNFSFSRMESSFLKKILGSVLPVILFLAVYFAMRPHVMEQIGMLDNDMSKATTSFSSELFDMQAVGGGENKWYKLTPAMIFKNIGILYFLGILPIDTTAVYYRNYIPLILTTLLSLIWALYLLRPFACYIKRNWQEAVLMVLLIIWLSLPSMITRAGEISPLSDMTFITIFMGFILDKSHKNNALFLTAFSCFIASTLITDIHKYYMSFKSGHIPMVMADEIIKQMPHIPESVYLIKIDNYSGKKTGAFIYNIGDGFKNGESVRHKYNYEYPKHTTVLLIPETDVASIYAKVDSVVDCCKRQLSYDYIWFVYNENVKVYDVKKPSSFDTN